MKSTMKPAMIKQAIMQSISKRVNHENVALVNRANSAILLSIIKCGNKIFVPKEGGWLTYKKYAKQLGKECVEIETDQAIIDLDDLERKINNKESGDVGNVFIYHSLGGYCAPQDIRKIYQICKENNCIVVMDVCGSFGTKFCDGKFADICLGSFGKWKIIDFGCGGFMSFQTKEMHEMFKPLLSAVTFVTDEKKYEDLLHKIDSTEERVEFLQNKREKIVRDLRKSEIVHKKASVGFVVIIKPKTELEKLEIIGYCTKNGLEYTLCPREIRILEEAISIEIKRLS
jgi:hypothetical protein